MKIKPVITAILLGFVAASIAMLTFGNSDTSEPKDETTQSTRPNRVIIYYFHGNVRCVTCRAIEQQTIDAIRSKYPDQLHDGSLELKTVNVEDPGNRHFVQDYKLVTRSVVLSRIVDGKETSWKNLERVWELVREKDEFRTYIQQGTQAFMESGA